MKAIIARQRRFFPDVAGAFPCLFSAALRVSMISSMPVIPKGRIDRLSFYERHVDRWLENAAAIGASAEEVAALAAEAQEARQALADQQQALQAARSATLRFNLALRRLSRRGGGIMNQIRARAQMSSDPGVYVLASVPAPARPTPLAAPGKPEAIAADLLANGVIELRWTCKNPRGSEGTLYQIVRQDRPDGPLIFLGWVGKKRFTDQTVPPGTASVLYQIQALRSKKKGPLATHRVHFGCAWSPPMIRPRARAA
jgi:hypothetical protein